MQKGLNICKKYIYNIYIKIYIFVIKNKQAQARWEKVTKVTQHITFTFHKNNFPVPVTLCLNWTQFVLQYDRSVNNFLTIRFIIL